MPESVSTLTIDVPVHLEQVASVHSIGSFNLRAIFPRHFFTSNSSPTILRNGKHGLR